MSDPEMTTFGMYPNWGVESCKSYAEQLRDKTRANRAEHAAECIEYLLSVVQKKWVGLADEEILADDVLRYHFGMNGGAGPVSKKGKTIIEAIEAKLKEKNT